MGFKCGDLRAHSTAPFRPIHRFAHSTVPFRPIHRFVKLSPDRLRTDDALLYDARLCGPYGMEKAPCRARRVDPSRRTIEMQRHEGVSGVTGMELGFFGLASLHIHQPAHPPACTSTVRIGSGIPNGPPIVIGLDRPTRECRLPTEKRQSTVFHSPHLRSSEGGLQGTSRYGTIFNMPTSLGRDVGEASWPPPLPPFPTLKYVNANESKE